MPHRPRRNRPANRLARSSGLPIIAACAVMLGATPAWADEDAQAWGAVIANGAVRGDLFLWLEAQARATDGPGDGSQIILRPGVGAIIGRDAHAVAGYAFVRTQAPGGAISSEHRPWQQVQFVPLRHKGGTPLAISRSRLEQRMVEGRSGTAWRWRQLARVQVPLGKPEGLHAIAITEGFFNLNSASWGPRSGVDQWRNFVGVSVPVSPRARLEPGYLNQRVFRPGDDRTNHVMSVTMVARL